MTLRPKVYLLLLIILVLLNISLAVLIRDAKHMNQRDEFTRDSNERVALFNQFTETLESEVDEQKLISLYQLLARMEAIRVQDPGYLLQADYTRQINEGWKVMRQLESGKDIDTAAYNVLLESWNRKIDQQEAMYKNKIITYRVTN